MPAVTSPSTIRAVLGALTGHPGATAAELAVAAGLSRSTVSKALAVLEADQQVTRQTGSRDGARRLADRWTLRTNPPSEADHDTATEPPPAIKTATEPPPAPESVADTETTGHVPVSDEPEHTGPRRLGKGQLRAMVLAYLQAQPGREHSPTAIAKALDRSAGAVSNALEKLVVEGTVTQTSEKPRRFAVPA
jgi:DNA-binding MarR family transcriptional regulator